MRLPEGAVRLLLLAAVVAIAATGCSRLTFVKSDASRGKTRQVAPDYSFRSTPEDRRRAEAAAHVSRADRALVAGEFDAAAGYARDALRVDSKSADALTLLALVAVRNGQASEAGDFYRRAADAAPDNGLVLNNYGAWLCGNGRASEAMVYFDRAIADQRYGRVADAVANAGACADAGGQPGRVERDLRVALGLDPTNAVALSAMAEYQYRSGRYLEARAFSERRLATASATPGALLLASQIETSLGDMAAAERYRQRLETEFPRALSE